MIYVDWLMPHGWKMYGRSVESCHMFSDKSKDELNEFALKIGLKKRYLQKSSSGVLHYDLVSSVRIKAIKMGALEIQREKYIKTMKKIKEVKT